MRFFYKLTEIWTSTVCRDLSAWAVMPAVVGAVLFSYACQSSSREVVGPSGVKCEISVPSDLPLVGAAGGSGSLTITAARECAWSVASGAPWITITSPLTGQGTGVVNYTAAGNPAPTERRGTLTVGERQVELRQEPAPCQFTLTPSGLMVDADGGESLVAVNTIDGCTWTAVSDANWIAIAAPAEGTGAGALRLLIEPNAGGERTGHLRIAAGLYTVTQQSATAPPCVPTIASAGQAVPAIGAPVSVGVSAPGGCTWTAISHAPWIAIIRGAVGSGDGMVELRVSANTGPERAGIVRVAGQTFTVTQSGTSSTPSCSYSLGSTEQSVAAAGGPLSVSVSVAAGCGWTAATQVPWINVTSGAQGAGSGVVALTVAANTGAQRSGVVNIAGHNFTVTQAAVTSTPCSYTLSSSAESVTDDGASLSVGVTTTNTCEWTAVSQASWITVTAGAADTGSGTVTLNVSANTGSQRSGVVRIAGQNFTVTQAANSPPCSYGLSAANQSVGASGGPFAVGVTTASSCAWTASSQAAWITVTAGAAGTGNGTVSLSVANNIGAQRSGVVIIAGQTFTVTQAAVPPPCTYSINPTHQSAPALGGNFTVAVTTQAGCSWTARSNAGWIAITGSSSGTGNGTVTYSVGLGLVLLSREGTMTVAGQTLTISQAGLLIAGGSDESPSAQHVKLATSTAAPTKVTP